MNSVANIAGHLSNGPTVNN